MDITLCMGSRLYQVLITHSEESCRVHVCNGVWFGNFKIRLPRPKLGCSVKEEEEGRGGGGEVGKDEKQ
jgi:hypothetical protein